MLLKPYAVIHLQSYAQIPPETKRLGKIDGKVLAFVRDTP